MQSYPLRLTISGILTIFLVKLFFFVTGPIPMDPVYLMSFIQDAFIIVANHFLFVFCSGNFSRIPVITRPLFYFSFTVITASCGIYTFFIPDLLIFAVNIFGVPGGTAYFFVDYFLSYLFILSVITCMSGVFILARFFPKKIPSQRFLQIPAILLTLLFVPTILRPAINPVIYSLQEQIVMSIGANEGLVKLSVPIADSADPGRFSFLNRGCDSVPLFKSGYKRVIVLVMESVNYSDFMKKSTNSPNSFLNKHRTNIISFHNYHTLNLDSYTSLIAIINSIFVPYRAYADESRFLFVNNMNNLVRIFNVNGFFTLFITSYGRQQERFVPDIPEWSEKIFMKDIENNKDFACITSTKIETACEDLAVMDDLMRTAKKDTLVFIFQEMVYGHTAGWKDKTGIETVDYYNNYFNLLVENLENQNLLDSTLIAVLADHGPRDDVYDEKNYRVPLLFFAKNISGKENNEFLSHLVFKDMLLNLISGRPDSIAATPVYTLGNSGELVYGCITPEGKYVFINNRMRYSKGNFNGAEILSFNKSFQEYLNYFEFLKENKLAE